MEDLGGNWKGEYIAVNGMHATLNLTLKTKEKTLSGRYKIELQKHHGFEILEGDMHGNIAEKSVIFKLELGKNFGTLEIESYIVDASPYAKQALYGTIKENRKLNVRGGIWIAWKFATDGACN